MQQYLIKTALFLLFFAPLSLSATPRQALVPGGLAIIPLPSFNSETSVTFNDNRTTLFNNGGSLYALAGISLRTKPGTYYFKINQNGRLIEKIGVQVAKKQYEEQHLTIKNKRKVNPNKEDMARISKERVRKRKAKNHWTATYPDVEFIWPVTGETSSVFGLRRFFNKQERNPHNGLDIAAPEGTDIKVTANGTVIEAGDFFFSGNMVYVDHGQGLISLYAHMSRIDVKPGDVVKRGDIIGAVGQTGRVTGAHLHFAILANGVLVDPVYFLPEQQPARKLTKIE